MHKKKEADSVGYGMRMSTQKQIAIGYKLHEAGKKRELDLNINKFLAAYSLLAAHYCCFAMMGQHSYNKAILRLQARRGASKT